jgi:filamentous hemagglutinin
MLARRSPVGSSSLSYRALSAAVLSALLGTPLALHAQVTPDPHAGMRRPGTDTAANGVPVVNLTAPSAAGVSHNQYQQFNVDPQGLILNNSSAVSSTQLGGYITGNPNYQAGQSATLIVNEVTSTNPSYLRGYTEVAGNAADVIVANPNGIHVDGAGFINTPRATLTTGVPVFNGDGSLSALRVTGGQIAIEGAGLNASNIDRLDMVARSLAVNGKVWANNLNVVTGANQVDYAGLAAQAMTGDGEAPTISLDVAALGGMYAHRIALIGTEAGIGVRNAGDLATQSGDFILTQAGQLLLTGTTASAGHLTLDAGAVNNSGTLQAAGDMAVRSAGDLSNTGTIYGGGDLNLTAGNTLTNNGVIAAARNASVHAQQLLSQGVLGAGVAGDGRVQGSGSLSVVTAGALAAHGSQLAAGNITLQGGALDLSGAQTQAGGDIALTSTTGDIDHRNGTLVASGALTVRSAGTVDNSNATMQASQIDANASAWRNAYGSVMQTGNGPMSLRIGGMLDNTHGVWVSSARDLSISAGALDNSQGQIKALDGDLDLIVSQIFNQDSTGFLGSNRNVNLTLGNVSNAGQIYAGGDLALNVHGDASNSGAIQAQGNVDATVAGTLTNDNGRLEAGDGTGLSALTLNAAAISNQHGRLANTGSGTTTITSHTLGNTGGTVGGQGDVALRIAQIDNHAGTLVAGGNLALQSGDLNNSSGTLYSAGHVTWNNSAATLDNTNGSFSAGADIALTLGTVHNDAGDIASNHNVAALFAAFDGSGRLRAGNDLSLTLAGDYTHQAGNTLFANHDFTFNLGGTFTNQGNLQSVNALTLNAARVDNQAGATIDSTATTVNAATQTNAGRLEGDTVTLNGTAITNTGTVIGNAVTIHAANLTNGADLGTATDNNAYQSALIAATDQLKLYVTGDLLNRDATLYSLGDLTIAADADGARSHSVTNRSGDIEAGGNVSLSAEQFTNQRRVFETEAHQLTPAEQALNTLTLSPLPMYRYDDPNPEHHPPYVDPSQILSAAQVAQLESYCGTLGTPGKDGDNWCNGATMPGQDDAHNILHNDLRAIVTQTLTSVERLKAASAENRQQHRQRCSDPGQQRHPQCQQPTDQHRQHPGHPEREPHRQQPAQCRKLERRWQPQCASRTRPAQRRHDRGQQRRPRCGPRSRQRHEQRPDTSRQRQSGRVERASLQRTDRRDDQRQRHACRASGQQPQPRSCRPERRPEPRPGGWQRPYRHRQHPHCRQQRPTRRRPRPQPRRPRPHHPRRHATQRRGNHHLCRHQRERGR